MTMQRQGSTQVQAEDNMTWVAGDVAGRRFHDARLGRRLGSLLYQLGGSIGGTIPCPSAADRTRSQAPMSTHLLPIVSIDLAALTRSFPALGRVSRGDGQGSTANLLRRWIRLAEQPAPVTATAVPSPPVAAVACTCGQRHPHRAVDSLAMAVRMT